MNLSSYLFNVRQYAQLSARKHVSYAPVVDKLTDMLKDEAAKLNSNINVSFDQIDEMRDREYNPVYRSFPPSRPPE